MDIKLPATAPKGLLFLPLKPEPRQEVETNCPTGAHINTTVDAVSNAAHEKSTCVISRLCLEG